MSGGSSISTKSGSRAGRAKSSKKVTVTKYNTTPDTSSVSRRQDPSSRNQGAHKKKKEEEDPKK